MAAGEIVFEFVGERQVVVEVGVGGFEQEAGAELLDGVVEVALLEVGDAEVFAEDGGGWSGPEGALVDRDGGGCVAGLNQGQAVVDEGVRAGRL